MCLVPAARSSKCEFVFPEADREGHRKPTAYFLYLFIGFIFRICIMSTRERGSRAKSYLPVLLNTYSQAPCDTRQREMRAGHRPSRLRVGVQILGRKPAVFDRSLPMSRQMDQWHRKYHQMCWAAAPFCPDSAFRHPKPALAIRESSF